MAHSRSIVLEEQLHQLVQRLMRHNRTKRSRPVIIAGAHCRGKAVSAGKVVNHVGGRVNALVDNPLECDQEITVFLTDHVYIGEVLKCVAAGKRFSVELLLIQYKK